MSKNHFPLVSTFGENYITGVRNTKVFSNADFLARVREYMPMDASSWETDADGKPHANCVAAELSENIFYLFDADALHALSCAIEDVALEEAKGVFLAAIQDFKQFDAFKERYWQLAATLDDVQVVATGKTPRRNGHIKFCNAGESSLKDFWIVLYQGPRTQILLLCEQARSRSAEDKTFFGFYTLNPRVISQARKDIVDLLGGKCPDLRQFGYFRKIDQAAKRVKIEFAREQKALEIAIDKLKDSSDKYGAKDFIHDLDETLERLNQLKLRLPEFIVGHR